MGTKKYEGNLEITGSLNVQNGIIATIKGSSESANKLKTPRTITLGGAVTGSVDFDGSQNVTLTTTTNHSHTYAGSTSAGGAANSVKTSLTFNNGGSGAASGTTFNGSTAKTISYNTIGAAPTSHASSGTTYGVATTGNYGHVKISNENVDTTTAANGLAAGMGHTHNYAGSDSEGGAATNALQVSGTISKSASNNVTIGDESMDSSNYSLFRGKAIVPYTDNITNLGATTNTTGNNSGKARRFVNGYFSGTVYATTFNGQATSAAKLTNTSAIGSTTNPVYFTSGGVPSACTYSLNKTVPSDAVFTDTKVTQSAAVTTNSEYPVLLGYSTSTSSAVTNTVNTTSSLKYNPSTGRLTAKRLNISDSTANTTLTLSNTSTTLTTSPVLTLSQSADTGANAIKFGCAGTVSGFSTTKYGGSLFGHDTDGFMFLRFPMNPGSYMLGSKDASDVYYWGIARNGGAHFNTISCTDAPTTLNNLGISFNTTTKVLTIAL